ncbi:uncharacterized protein FOMMEDRAFT_142942 [Fomitiporia mediterranea MF3/22]|uniref:uncharacterized protein n=1 Tax=Fomitiporia mediterranea (strain MF3/22) TaxID=694068 RepID=UPI0004408830|nr:uncharacterized protein FOMMEDRAFT_142942 [Fomitiporia mediterranea MF3/22]EJC98876.1 hypothetical protein FOMMEDRAFT_142942 [Fomitiporia mediterranea MF3/22]
MPTMSSHTLPSFAQAFSALDDRDRALPPIHSHPHSPYLRHESRNEARHDSHGPPHPPPPSLPPLKRDNRKRPLERDDSSEPSSPRIVKQEQDVDQLDPSPPPPQSKPSPPKASSPARPQRTRQQLHLNTNVGSASSNSNNATNNAGATAVPASTTTNSNTTATTTNANANAAPPHPPPSLVRPQQHAAKRRRVTISGVAHPSMRAAISYGDGVGDPAHAHAHTPPPPTHTGPNTPISPVVMGFTIQRDPQAVEQVRAMLAVKQKQKALIESRRGSAAGLAGIEGGRRGSNAGIDATGRRASVAAPSVTVNIVNPTPTSATGPGPGSAAAPVAPPLRRTGSSPNGQRLGPTPPTMSPNARANASRTRSPSLLSGARNTSPTPNPNQPARAAPLHPPPPSSNLSPPSHHSHPHSHPQGHPHVASGRQQRPSPPRPAPPTPVASSSSTNAANASTQAQNQNQAPTFVASQGLSALAHNLPPPPNSFTRRRAGQLGLRGNKPADLMISPRESESVPAPKTSASGSATAQVQAQQQQQQYQQQHNERHNAPLLQTPTHSLTQGPPHRAMHMPSVPVNSSFKNLQPAIQSAPPRPGQQPGRFPMALPSLPPAMGQAGAAVQRGTSVRKAPGQVPPTPTRLSMQRAQGTMEATPVRLSQPTGLPRVPRTATAATFATPHGTSTGSTSSALMPATPATRHRASGAGANSDKAAFLAPFEQFFDALSDAQVLKGWFSEQLRRVGAVAKEGEAQVARLKAAAGEGGISRNEVESLVREAVQQEARMWRDEVSRLQSQVTELRETIRELRSFEPSASAAGGRNTQNQNQGGRPPNGLSPRPPFQPTPPVSSGGTTTTTTGGYPTAPGVESYTFPPVPRPPTTAPVPSSSGTGSMQQQQRAGGPPPPSSSATTMVDDVHRRSVSPPPREDTSAYGGRSVSRSAASSPAPSLEGMSGIGRRLSVSAMRFEPQLKPLPVRSERLPLSAINEKEREREQEREREREKERKERRPETRRTNSTSGAGVKSMTTKTGNGEGKTGGGGEAKDTTKRPDSPMDES